MDEKEKLAILMAERDSTKMSLTMLAQGQQELRDTMNRLPEELGRTIREECITRREFRTAKGAFGVIAVAVSTIISTISYILGLGK